MLNRFRILLPNFKHTNVLGRNLSTIVSNYVCNDVGLIKMRQIITEEKNHYCCEWRIGKDAIKDRNQVLVLNSPKFTIPHKNECKWYFSIEFQKVGEFSVYCPVRLILDDSSDCKAAIANFKGSVISGPLFRDWTLQLSRTLKFDKKLENKADIVSFKGSRCDILNDWNKRNLSFECDINIETTFPEDNTFSKDFGSLLENQRFTDVAIYAGWKKFKAHKAILAARSSVFAAMFAPNNPTSYKDVVHFRDMGRKVVEEMLRYIYTGEVEQLDYYFAKDLIIVADKYDLKGLRCKCEEFLIESLSSSNAFDLLLFADVYNANYLKSAVIDFIAVKDTRLMKTSALKNLKQTNPEVFQEIFEVNRRSILSSGVHSVNE